MQYLALHHHKAGKARKNWERRKKKRGRKHHDQDERTSNLPIGQRNISSTSYLNFDCPKVQFIMMNPHETIRTIWIKCVGLLSGSWVGHLCGSDPVCLTKEYFCHPFSILDSGQKIGESSIKKQYHFFKETKWIQFVVYSEPMIFHNFYLSENWTDNVVSFTLICSESWSFSLKKFFRWRAEKYASATFLQ